MHYGNFVFEEAGNKAYWETRRRALKYFPSTGDEWKIMNTIEGF